MMYQYFSRYPLRDIARFIWVGPQRENVDFQLLPPDAALNLLYRIGNQKSHAPGINSVVLPERLKFLQALRPSKMVIGLQGLGTREYRGYIFGPVVILECERYGNAVFIIHSQDLETVGQLTKKQLRASGKLLACVRHAGDWQGRIRKSLSSQT